MSRKPGESLVQACNQRIAVSTVEGVHFTIALEKLIVEGGQKQVSQVMEEIKNKDSEEGSMLSSY